MKNTYFLLFFCFSTLVATGQRNTGPNHYCFTDELWANMVQHDSSLLIARRQMDAVISKFSNRVVAINRNTQKSGSSIPATIIPTVIYVVYDTLAVNISMRQIQSQMDQLNASFAPYGYSFCYARRNVSDTSFFVPHPGDSIGVFRIRSALSNADPYTDDAQLKALSTLPATRYLRIFIVHSITPQGVLGYAILPRGYSAQDGIVIRSDVFGSNNFCDTCDLYPDYNLGATLTHEAGHFLDLYHTFQGGCYTGTGLGACQEFGDQVCDTPPCEGSFGCPSPAPLSCDGIHSELIQNYMDYTNDHCKNSFTSGQNARMDYATLAYRSVLVSTENLINTGVACVELGNQYANFYCANYNGCLNRAVTFASLASPGFTYSWDFGDGSNAVGDTVQHIYTSTGEFQVTLSAVNTALNVSATNTTAVFITECQPINCGLNKWDANFSYLDFSSGTAVAQNHVASNPANPFPTFYHNYYRGDEQGRPLFHLITEFGGQGPAFELLDTSFQAVDSLSPGEAAQVLPVIATPGKYCIVQNLAWMGPNGTSGVTDSVIYSYILAANGTVSDIPGKKSINIPLPVGSQFDYYNYVMTSIPNCDGTKFWIIAYLQSVCLQFLK